MKRLLYLLPGLTLLFTTCSKNNDNVNPENKIDFSISESYTDTAFRINDIIQLADSSYILVGGASINKGNFQNLIMKYNKSGKRVWVNIKSNSDSPKGFSRVFPINKNKLSAYRDKGFAYDPAPRIVDYDSKGKLTLQNFVNTSITMHGLDYVAGSYFLAGEKSSVVAFQELDPNGTSKWLKFYNSGKSMLSISSLSDTTFITIGGGDISISSNLMMKLNNKGDTLWTKPRKGFTVQGLADGNFLAITGGPQDIQFQSFDNSGSAKWKSDYSDANSSSYDQGCYNILAYQSQYFIFTMLKNDGILYCYEYDLSGNLVNTIKINDIQSGTQVAATNTIDNGLIVVKSVTSTAPGKVELIKYSNVTP
jgi:hypothetical protein